MDIDIAKLDVEDNRERSRFEVRVENELAFVDYARAGDVIAYTHTEVPPSLEGHGIAGALAKHALDYARAAGLKVVPLCPYVKSYIERHPEYADLVAPRSAWRPFLRR